MQVTSDGDVSGGTVHATVDGTTLPDVVLTGPTAKVPLPATLAAGHHTVTVTYAGNAETAAASPAQATVTVAKASTTTTAKAARPRRGKVAVSVKVTAPGSSVAPTGKVTGTVNGKAIRATTLRHGTARVTVPLKKGTNKIVLHYPAGSNFAGSSSKTITVKG